MFPSHLPTPRRPAAQSIPILRWGIIGPGWIAERFVHSLKTYSRQQVVAVASRSQAKADRVAAEWGIPQAYGQVEEMLARPDIDAVYIATPHNHHFPDGMQALKAGKHVLIEKPFALNLGEGRELQAEAARQEKLALEAMWCDYAPKYDVIRQLLEDGALGDLHTLLADHGEYFTRDHRIFNADLAGGPMMDLGSYVTSFALMVGGMPQEIVARGSDTAEGLNGQNVDAVRLAERDAGVVKHHFVQQHAGRGGGGRTPGDPDDRRPVLRPRRLHARRQPGRAGAALGRAAQSLRPAVLAGGAFCLVHRTGVAGLAAAAAQSGAAESAGDG